MRRGDREAVQRIGAIAGVAKREARPLGELVIVAARRADELECRAPVVREHLRVVLRPTKARDPLGTCAVPLRPVRARDLPVGDVADERMREGELALAFERRASLATDEALALEGVQRGGRGVGVASEPARPEHLPDDGCILQEALLGVRKPVEASGNDALKGLREGELIRRALLDVQLDELLRVERVAAGSLEQRLLRLGRQHRASEEVRDELRRLLVGERRERERRRVELAAAPARPPLEKLGPRGRDDQQRNVGDPVDELVEEVEEALVGPVDVLGDEDERTLLRKPFEEASPRGERFVAAIAAELGLVGESEECEEVRLYAHFVAGTRERVRDGLMDLLRDLGGCVLFDDTRLRLHDLAERPQRDSVPVGEAAALPPRDELRIGIGDTWSSYTRRLLPMPGTPTSVTS